jgi:cysteine synthase
MHTITNHTAGVLDLIGNTPVVEIKRLNPNPNVRIFAKLEGCNPAGSVKDRIARAMIEAAERDGILTPERVLIEPTSGNTGIGLALVAALKGYRFVAVMPECASKERCQTMAAFGADLILSDGSLGTNYAIEVAQRMLQEDERYLMLDQFSNPANVEAHYHGTGVEIARQVPEVDVFVAGMGTGGTLMGVGRRLREERPGVRIVGLEPRPGTAIQGLRNMDDYVPPIFNWDELDERLTLDDEAAFQTTRDLARAEGIFAGMSSGAAVWGAMQVARRMERGTIVTLLPDGGSRYFSTTLYPTAEQAVIRLVYP